MQKNELGEQSEQGRVGDLGSQWGKPMGEANGGSLWGKPVGEASGGSQWGKPMGEANGGSQCISAGETSILIDLITFLTDL